MALIRDEINPTDFWDDTEDRFRAYSFAEEVAEKYELATTIENDEMWLHDGQIWQRQGEQFIRGEVRAMLRDTATREVVNEVMRNLKHLTRKPREQMFDLEPEKVVLENGVLDLLSGEFFGRWKTPGTRTRVEIRHDEEAYPERFNQFLFEVLPAEDVSIMWELIGYCLYSGYPFQKAAMFLGEGANGKSTLLAAIEDFLGERNVASAELQDLGDNRFAIADLEGKLANIAPDLSDDDLENTGKFKALTGGDLVRAERKYEGAFHFRNYATLLFSTNTPPSADDNTFAYERRWLYFQFPHKFTGSDATPQEELLEEFREEHPGMLNVAAESFRNLWERGGFEETTYMSEHDDVHERTTDHVVAFVQDHLKRRDESSVRTKTAYEAYRRWAEQNGQQPQGRDYFEQKVLAMHAPEKTKDQEDKRFDLWADLELVDVDVQEAGDAPDSKIDDYE